MTEVRIDRGRTSCWSSTSRTTSAPAALSPSPMATPVVPVANDLTGRFANVVLTQDWHPGGHSSFASSHEGAAEPFSTMEMSYGPQTLWPDHCVRDSSGAAFHAGLETGSADLIIRKGSDPTVDFLFRLLRKRPDDPDRACGLSRDPRLRPRGADWPGDRFLRPLHGDGCAARGFRRGRGRGRLPCDRPRRIARPGHDGDAGRRRDRLHQRRPADLKGQAVGSLGA